MKTNEFPFDHIVIVMQENHSFDNYFGMLPLRGQPLADGFTFDGSGKPTNSNPLNGEREVVYHQTSFAGSHDSGSQNWNDTHEQINGGAMDGFAATGPGSMGYWDDTDLPFYYSLANTFTLANRWFCSAPCQTYPNRRFLMAGTASGIISTDLSNITTNYPAAGTIWDQLSAHGITWHNYFSDAPTTAIMLETIEKHPLNLAHIEQFYLDAALGTLPSVSLVDCNMGAVVGEINRRGAEGEDPDLRRHHQRRVRDHLGVRGEPAGRPARRGVRGAHRQRCDARAGLEAHPARLPLRRARWLLRPRAPARGDRARRDRADAARKRRARRATRCTALACPQSWSVRTRSRMQ